jgi:hypothetical protein
VSRIPVVSPGWVFVGRAQGRVDVSAMLAEEGRRIGAMPMGLSRKPAKAPGSTRLYSSNCYVIVEEDSLSTRAS